MIMICTGDLMSDITVPVSVDEGTAITVLHDTVHASCSPFGVTSEDLALLFEQLDEIFTPLGVAFSFDDEDEVRKDFCSHSGDEIAIALWDTIEPYAVSL